MSIPLFTHLEVETIGSCNRTCSTCLRQNHQGGGDTHEGRFPVSKKVGIGNKMPRETFERVLREAVEMGFAGTLCLQHFNEPLLDDRIASLAEFAQQFSFEEVSICTNADFVTEERAKELDGVLDSMKVTLYMDEPMKSKREEWLVRQFKKTRLDFNRGMHIVTHFSPYQNLQTCLDDTKSMPCTRFNHMLIVAYDGTVLHCCDDYSGHFGLGNVNELSVREIWESEVHAKLVADLGEEGGRSKYNYCANCPRY